MAHGHRSGRVTHGQKVKKDIRLPCPGRCPGDAVQHLLHQHLVVRRRDVGDLEKTPTTTLLAPPVPALAPARHPQTQRALAQGHKESADSHGRPDRTALRAAGAAEAATAPRGTAAEATRESSRSDFGVLKSTGCGRRVPRSASPARAPCRPCASGQLQPAFAPDLGRYRPAAPASPIICTGSRQFVSLAKSAVVEY
jgi:hypothetical protein